MDIPELHGPNAPPRRQTYIGYITTARRPPTKPTKKSICGSAGKKHARGRQHRSTTQRRGGALDL